MINSLLNMYLKCGSIDEAESIFNKMKSRNVVSWNNMIEGYAHNGYGKKAIEIFKEMENQMIKPNSTTFINLLKACSANGLANEALYYLNIMNQYEVIPDIIHYNDVIDALGRAGYIEEAENVIKTMKQQNIVTWENLLQGCYLNNDVERGESAAENALKLAPQNASIYMTLANIYSVAQRWDDVTKIMLKMKENNIKIILGNSWIEINGTVHSFFANDKSHQHWNDIQTELKRLHNKMRASGYISNTNFFVHDITDQNDNPLCSYSEKLAVVLGLISTPSGQPLFVVKDQNLCPDCHYAIKIFSKFCNRKITIRYANYFHHF